MKKRYIFSLLIIALLAEGCEKKDKIIPVVETYAPQFVASNAATIGVRVTSSGSGEILACGIYIGTSAYPETTGVKIGMGTDTGLYLGQITGLTPSTQYYVKGYAMNPDGEGLGFEVTFVTPPTVLDIDNNEYPALKVGNKVWMAKNLRATHFLNGDEIPTTVAAGTDISSETDPLYRWYYNGDYGTSLTYGNLYTWHTMTDARKVCPAGWHLPTDAEWTALENALGGYTIAGSKLKEPDNEHWLEPYNTDATDESCFTALPGGYRASEGSYFLLENEARFWTSTESETANAWARTITATSTSVTRAGMDKKWGLSVRCIKD